MSTTPTQRTDSTGKTAGNGDSTHAEITWTDLQHRSHAIVAGEIDTSATVLRMPKPPVLRAWWADMVRQAAHTLGARNDGSSRLRWIPLASLIVGLLMSAGAIVMAYGVFRGRTETKEEVLSDNQKATAVLISASEARLMQAANEMRQSAKEMRVELNGKVDAIDGKVESIRGSVASQQAQLEGLRARLDAANDDKGRLWQTLETYRLKLERLERERLGIAPLPPPSSVTPQH